MFWMDEWAFGLPRYSIWVCSFGDWGIKQSVLFYSALFYSTLFEIAHLLR